MWIDGNDDIFESLKLWTLNEKGDVNSIHEVNLKL